MKPIVLVAVAVLATASTQAIASLDDCYRATCRIYNDGGSGSGCVIGKDTERYYVLTNAHVAGAQDGTPVECVFNVDGHELPRAPGTNIWSESGGADLAIIAIDRKKLPFEPPVIQLGEPGHLLASGDGISTAGAPLGGWITQAHGHVVSINKDLIEFVPTPARGRSGSGIFDLAGTKLLGVVTWNSPERRIGIAQSVDVVWGALAGELSGENPTNPPSPPDDGIIRVAADSSVTYPAQSPMQKRSRPFGHMDALRPPAQRDPEAAEADSEAAEADPASKGETVLLDFYADWCGPCKQIAPIIDQVKQQGYPVRKVNTDLEAATARRYSIQAMPTLVLLKNGREVRRQVGGHISVAGLVGWFKDAGCCPPNQQGGGPNTQPINPGPGPDYNEADPTPPAQTSPTPLAPIVPPITPPITTSPPTKLPSEPVVVDEPKAPEPGITRSELDKIHDEIERIKNEQRQQEQQATQPTAPTQAEPPAQQPAPVAPQQPTPTPPALVAPTPGTGSSATGSSPNPPTPAPGVSQRESFHREPLQPENKGSSIGNSIGGKIGAGLGTLASAAAVGALASLGIPPVWRRIITPAIRSIGRQFGQRAGQKVGSDIDNQFAKLQAHIDSQLVELRAKPHSEDQAGRFAKLSTDFLGRLESSIAAIKSQSQADQQNQSQQTVQQPLQPISLDTLGIEPPAGEVVRNHMRLQRVPTTDHEFNHLKEAISRVLAFTPELTPHVEQIFGVYNQLIAGDPRNFKKLRSNNHSGGVAGTKLGWDDPDPNKAAA